MRTKAFALALALLLSGCSSSGARTGLPGIRYGMTPAEVLERLEPTQQILDRAPGILVTEGYDRTRRANRRNTFVFRDGKLAAHENVPAEEPAPR